MVYYISNITRLMYFLGLSKVTDHLLVYASDGTASECERASARARAESATDSGVAAPLAASWRRRSTHYFHSVTKSNFLYRPSQYTKTDIH